VGGRNYITGPFENRTMCVSTSRLSRSKELRQRKLREKKEEKKAHLEKAFINLTYQANVTKEKIYTYLYFYTYMKLLRRFKPIIGKGQTDLARLPLHLFTCPVAPYLFSMRVE